MEESVYVHTDLEIANFINDYKPNIYGACKHAKLNRSLWDVVLNTVAIKFAVGKITAYNPTLGTKYSTYIFEIARNCAVDERKRQHAERFHEMEEKGWEQIADGHDCDSRTNADDEKQIVTEALKRFVKEMHDMTKAEILVRYAINGEKREKLAEEYGVQYDFISLVKTRYMKRLQVIAKEVLKQDEAGKLKLSDTDISFLKPYMKW